MRSTQFVFTINNPSDKDHQNVLSLMEREDVIQLIAEDETGEQNTPHIQGYIHFNRRIYQNTLNIWLDRNAHIEKARSTAEANYRYCTKEGNIFASKGFDAEEHFCKKDTREEERNKKALQKIADIGQLKEKEFILKYPGWYLSHRKEYMQFKTDFDNEKLPNYEGDLKEKNFWIYGSAGSGKSVLPTKWTSSDKICRKTSNKWFDGYMDYHQIIVIDDLAPGLNDQSARNIKNLADRYKFIVEVKNGTKVISPNNYCLVITTNYTIEQIFPNPEDHDPIRRRFSFIDADSAKALGAKIDPPPFLQKIKERNIPVSGKALIEAIAEIGEQVRKPKDPLEEAAQYLDSIQTQIKASREKQSQRIKQLDEKKLRRMSLSQKRKAFKEAGYNSSEADDAIELLEIASEEVSSQVEDWRIPDPPSFQRAQVAIDEFSDVPKSESEEDTLPGYDCTMNHSQTIRTDDPLLDALKTSDSESTDIDLDTSSE